MAWQANRASELNATASERHILYQLKIQADVMRRRGIDEDLIAQELKCMGSAMRTPRLTELSLSETAVR
jgi:hypothetical protein